MPYLERHTHGADKFVLSRVSFHCQCALLLLLFCYKETMHLFLNGHNSTAMVNSC